MTKHGEGLKRVSGKNAQNGYLKGHILKSTQPRIKIETDSKSYCSYLSFKEINNKIFYYLGT